MHVRTDMTIIDTGPGWVVIDKPAGMLSVPGKGPDKQDCAMSSVRAMFPEADGPMVVHRLDMDTSGLLLVALTSVAQRALSGQFERRAVKKRYIALVEGIVPVDEGTIDLPMRLDVDHRPHQVIDIVQGKRAETHWRVVSFETDRTRVQFSPVTGRSHQLRVHAAAARGVGGLGCPIVGDVLYGSGVGVVNADGTIYTPNEHCTTADRLMLHASWLGFRCPETGGVVEVESQVSF